MIEVMATRRGFHPMAPGKAACLIEAGVKFTIESEKLFTEEWMKRLSPPPVVERAPKGCPPDEPITTQAEAPKPQRKQRRTV